jgi:phage regulator Rha-like protein
MEIPAFAGMTCDRSEGKAFPFALKFCILYVNTRKGGIKRSLSAQAGRSFFMPKGVKMAKNDEKMEIVATNPLVESGVEKMIRVIRGKQVLLDRDIATLYGVETRAINQAVKRNIERFPERYCFQLAKDELENLKSQNVISSWGGDRFKPYVFTEQGFAMLSSVLKSKVAVNVSIAIMDAFVAMRQYLYQNGGIVNRLSNVESKDLEQDARLLEHDQKIDSLFEAMDRGELKSKGLFYNNQEFDAYVFVCNLIRKAKKRIVLVDRYVDEKVLSMMLKRNEGVSATIYTYDKSKVFEVDLATYNAQYADCPIEILPCYGMHDRFLFIDDTAYHFGASMKDLGKQTFFLSKEEFTLDEVLKMSKEKNRGIPPPPNPRTFRP